MLSLLESITFWHWIILALVLLGGEALGAAGFMLGISLSAVLVGVLMALGIVHDWQVQFLLFALFSVLASWVFWKYFRNQDDHDDAALINDRAAQLIGRRLTLASDITNGQGRIQIGDTLWKVITEEDLPAGTLVEVFGSDGMNLKICKAE